MEDCISDCSLTADEKSHCGHVHRKDGDASNELTPPTCKGEHPLLKEERFKHHSAVRSMFFGFDLFEFDW